MPSKRRHTRVRQLNRGLQDLIDQWDPVGLLKLGAPTDEYDCLVGPILSHLKRGESSDQLAAWLGPYIADHFGVPCPDARRFAVRARAWHVERGSRAV